MNELTIVYEINAIPHSFTSNVTNSGKSQFKSDKKLEIAKQKSGYVIIKSIAFKG